MGLRTPEEIRDKHISCAILLFCNGWGICYGKRNGSRKNLTDCFLQKIIYYVVWLTFLCNFYILNTDNVENGGII